MLEDLCCQAIHLAHVKERSYSHKLSSDLNMHAHACMLISLKNQCSFIFSARKYTNGLPLQLLQVHLFNGNPLPERIQGDKICYAFSAPPSLFMHVRKIKWQPRRCFQMQCMVHSHIAIGIVKQNTYTKPNSLFIKSLTLKCSLVIH